MKRMKKVLSLLLACCMLLGMLPASALAAELDAQQEEARQFALYMSELGLVDESGQLIQDNTFTVEDGTHLNSLDELLDWLGECEEADMGTLITVDATGRVATADLLLQAISVESQVGLLSTMLNLLSNGSTAVDTSAHDLHLVQKITNDSDNKDILILQVGVSKSADGEFIAAPNDIQIQLGLFVNHLRSVSGIYVNAYGPRPLWPRENPASSTRWIWLRFAMIIMAKTLRTTPGVYAAPTSMAKTATGEVVK